MKPCPECGEMLAPGLVEAIADPAAEESCPTSKNKPTWDIGLVTLGEFLAAARSFAAALTEMAEVPDIPDLIIDFPANRPGALAKVAR